MERETRLELATVCLEGRSSSQLSYSRFMVVRMRRLELPHREAPDPKSGVSTNFTTSALYDFLEKSLVGSLNQKKWYSQYDSNVRPTP